jgi:PTH1 family peptidyl-tRNA hydrolase
MKLVAGLGNPGREYLRTRHNVGFDVLDRLAEKQGLSWRTGQPGGLTTRWRGEGADVLLVKPQTFMNLSGEAVGAACRFYKIETADLLIVTDDVNLPLGRLRARATGSEGGHNGLRSIAEHLGTTDYARLRVGVGRGDQRRDLADHVLSKFDPEEQAAIQDAIARAADAVECWVADGLSTMMNRFNREAGGVEGT